MKRRLPAALATVALLAGCALPQQPPPASSLQTPAGWRGAAIGTDTTTAAAVQPGWWQGFGDPTLDALVQSALAANTDLRVARSRIAEYQARLTVAQAAQWPALSASFSPARTRTRTATGAFAETTVLQLGAQASYELDLWGRIDRLGEAAAADLQTQQAAADAAALSVAATTANGYLNLRGLDAQLELAQATLRSREESLQRARHLFETGYSSRLEWVQAESEWRAAAAAVPALQRSIVQQENALALLLGRNPGPLDRGLPLASLSAPAVDPSLPSTLLRRRPDIRQAEQRVAAADASLAASRDLLLPTVQLNLSASLQGNTLHQLLDAPARLWSLGGSILAPVLQGGRLRAGTEVAAALRDQAVFGYEQTVRNAFGEVENALVAVDALGAQAEQAQGRAEVAGEVLRIARNRQRNGYASYLEELDAQRTQYAAQQSLLQLRAAQLQAHVDLYRALGGGWQAPPDSAVSAP